MSRPRQNPDSGLWAETCSSERRAGGLISWRCSRRSVSSWSAERSIAPRGRLLAVSTGRSPHARIPAVTRPEYSRRLRLHSDRQGIREHGGREAIVDDVDAAIAFYTEQLGFVVNAGSGPALAIVSRGDLSLLAQWAAELGRPADARRQPARARRLEPPRPRGRGPEARSRSQKRSRSELQKRDRDGLRAESRCWLTIPAGNPVELFEPA